MEQEHVTGLPPLDYVRALRDMGAKFVRLGDAHIEFGELATTPAITLRPATAHAVRAFAQQSLVDPDDAEADVADAELTEEDAAKRAKEEYEKILFASAD